GVRIDGGITPFELLHVTGPVLNEHGTYTTRIDDGVALVSEANHVFISPSAANQSIASAVPNEQVISQAADQGVIADITNEQIGGIVQGSGDRAAGRLCNENIERGKGLALSIPAYQQICCGTQRCSQALCVADTPKAIIKT